MDDNNSENNENLNSCNNHNGFSFASSNNTNTNNINSFSNFQTPSNFNFNNTNNSNNLNSSHSSINFTSSTSHHANNNVPGGHSCNTNNNNNSLETPTRTENDIFNRLFERSPLAPKSPSRVTNELNNNTLAFSPKQPASKKSKFQFNFTENKTPPKNSNNNDNNNVGPPTLNFQETTSQPIFSDPFGISPISISKNGFNHLQMHRPEFQKLPDTPENSSQQHKTATTPNNNLPKTSLFPSPPKSSSLLERRKNKAKLTNLNIPSSNSASSTTSSTTHTPLSSGKTPGKQSTPSIKSEPITTSNKYNKHRDEIFSQNSSEISSLNRDNNNSFNLLQPIPSATSSGPGFTPNTAKMPPSSIFDLPPAPSCKLPSSTSSDLTPRANQKFDLITPRKIGSMSHALDDLFIQFYQKTKTSKFTDPTSWNKNLVRVWVKWMEEEFKINTAKMMKKSLDGKQVDSFSDEEFLKLWDPFEGDVCLSSWQFLKKTWNKSKDRKSNDPKKSFAPPGSIHDHSSRKICETARTDQEKKLADSLQAATGGGPIQLWHFLIELQKVFRSMLIILTRLFSQIIKNFLLHSAIEVNKTSSHGLGELGSLRSSSRTRLLYCGANEKINRK